MKYRLKILTFLLSVLMLAACSKKAVYIDESFSIDSPFKLRVDDDVALACEAARRSLLGQGYLIELANSDEVKARKATRGENTFIEMNIVCVPENNGSTIFATGVLSSYDLKKNSSSASVGVSALGSISLPIGQSIDSLVKVSEETIDDKGFYSRFFSAVDNLLSDLKIGRPPEVAEEELVDVPEPEEPAPAPEQSAIWPELFPEHVEPALVSDSHHAQPEPEITSEPLPAQIDPTVTEPQELSPVQSAPEISSETVVTEEPAGTFSASVPDEDLLGASLPVHDPENEPPGISPELLPVDSVPVATESVLAPIQVTAEKRAAPEAAADEQKAPNVESADFQAERIEDLF